VQKKAKKPRNKWTQWFVKIIEFILRNYKVEIIPEYQLYKEPMRIDIVVVKLLEDVVIKNSVMEFFRKHNIIEFKGPTDILNIEAFDRVLSYFYAYLSQNSLSPQDVTVTFISVKKPLKLLEILQKEREFEIIPSKQSGIYYIKSLIRTPIMQLVVNSELSVSDGAWLVNSIRDNWTFQEGMELVRKFEKTQDSNLLTEVMFELYTANIFTMKEGEDEMTRNEKAAMKFLDSWAVKSGRAQEWEQEGIQIGELRGEQRGMQRAKQQIFAALQQQGYDINLIKSKLPQEFA